MVKLQRDEIEAKTVRVLRAGAGSRPDVRLVEHEAKLLVLKDYSRGNLTVRLLGLLLLWRERSAYERLEGMDGVPRCYGRLDAFTLMTEYVESYQASEAPAALLTPDFFERLETLVRRMHARGVVHGDLKRLDNILVTPEGEPYLIDFSAAFWNGSSPASSVVMPHLIDDDMRAVYKLKARRMPHLLTAEEERFLNTRSGVERCFRVVREYFRRPVQHLAGSELGEGL